MMEDLKRMKYIFTEKIKNEPYFQFELIKYLLDKGFIFISPNIEENNPAMAHYSRDEYSHISLSKIVDIMNNIPYTKRPLCYLYNSSLELCFNISCGCFYTRIFDDKNSIHPSILIDYDQMKSIFNPDLMTAMVFDTKNLYNIAILEEHSNRYSYGANSWYIMNNVLEQMESAIFIRYKFFYFRSEKQVKVPQLRLAHHLYDASNLISIKFYDDASNPNIGYVVFAELKYKDDPNFSEPILEVSFIERDNIPALSNYSLYGGDEDFLENKKILNPGMLIQSYDDAKSILNFKENSVFKAFPILKQRLVQIHEK